MLTVLIHSYQDIISIKNLCQSWQEFIAGKKQRKDVAEFSLNLSQNIFNLHHDLKTYTYHHSPYHQFAISDPKPRIIHKATVRDRVVHRAIYRALYWHFHPRFIHDSYSCRLGKGTHRALERFQSLAYQASQNHTKTMWVLKCDIKSLNNQRKNKHGDNRFYQSKSVLIHEVFSHGQKFQSKRYDSAAIFLL